MNKLIIFIDGYPWEDSKLLDRVSFINSKKSMKPSYGYSVNLHYELFQGKKPNDLGFFGDALRVSSKKPSQNNFIKFLNIIRFKLPFISRVFYKIYSKLLKKHIAFLPPYLLNNFEFAGSYLLKNNEININDTTFNVVCFDNKLKFGTRDQNVYKVGLQKIKNNEKNLLLAFTELDWVFHTSGFRSKKYYEKVNQNITFLEELGQLYLEKNPDGEVVVLSDHGMADTKQSINFNLEDRFGMPFSNGVSYFYDSLYLFLWNDGNDKLFNSMVDWLSNQDSGHFISDDERKKYELDDPKFGSKIFLLNEGYGFAPNYFGYRLLKAYHGYAPDIDSMQGIFCSSRFMSDTSNIFTTSDVFNDLTKENTDN